MSTFYVTEESRRGNKHARTWEVIIPEAKRTFLDLTLLEDDDDDAELSALERRVLDPERRVIMSDSEDSDQMDSDYEPARSPSPEESEEPEEPEVPSLATPPPPAELALALAPEVLRPMPRAPSPDVLAELLSGIPRTYAAMINWENLDPKFDAVFEMERAERLLGGPNKVLKSTYIAQFEKTVEAFNRPNMTPGQRAYSSRALIDMIISFRQSQRKLFVEMK